MHNPVQDIRISKNQLSLYYTLITLYPENNVKARVMYGKVTRVAQPFSAYQTPNPDWLSSNGGLATSKIYAQCLENAVYENFPMSHQHAPFPIAWSHTVVLCRCAD